MRISVLGLGYVGLVTAGCAAEWGNDVVGMDASLDRVASLKAGRVPFYEPGLNEIVAKNLGLRRLSVTADPAAAVADAEIVVVAVGTHDGNGGWQSKTLIDCLAATVGRIPDDAALVIRSTIPLDLLPELPGLVRRLRAEAGRPPLPVLCNPEFTREGRAVHDFQNPDRVVIGVFDDQNDRGLDRMAEFYAPIDAPKLLLDGTDAILSKLGANLFLATKISFANELATVCDAFGGRVEEVVRAMGYDSRIGAGFLRAGVGFGGSCLPHQVTMMVKEAEEAGIETPLLSAVEEVNRHQREAVVTRLDWLLGGLDGRRVALLGLTFKPDTDDLRDAPALEIAERLIADGAEVVAYDPMEGARDRSAQLVPGLAVVATVDEALREADAAALVTEWPEFSALDWERVADLMAGRVIVDGRNALPESAIRAAGFRYTAFGRPSRARQPAAAMVPEAVREPALGAVSIAARAPRDRTAARTASTRTVETPVSV